MKRLVRKVVKEIEKKEWTFPPYSIQSWGNWLHRISPYVGRIKPSFAHFLIKNISTEGEIILDPFSGIGTIPVEAMLMNRNSIAVDLNPYAYYISLAKSNNHHEKEELIRYLKKIKVNTKNISIEKIPEWVKEYYNHETLKEILFLIKKLKKDRQYFLLGCLTGISQGHRPGHLSKPCAWTLPYKPRKDDKGEYREAIPRLIEKVNRTYTNGFKTTGKMKVYMRDARNLQLKNESVDHVISSPPYYDTLDYVGSHRLRLAILGYYDPETNGKLRNNLIQHFDTYLAEMELCIKEINRVLKNGGYCVFIVGDCFKGKKIINTAETLKPILEKNGFVCHAIIEDQIPMNKSVQKRSKEQKHDRIMILVKK